MGRSLARPTYHLLCVSATAHHLRAAPAAAFLSPSREPGGRGIRLVFYRMKDGPLLMERRALPGGCAAKEYCLGFWNGFGRRCRSRTQDLDQMRSEARTVKRGSRLRRKRRQRAVHVERKKSGIPSTAPQCPCPGGKAASGVRVHRPYSLGTGSTSAIDGLHVQGRGTTRSVWRCPSLGQMASHGSGQD